MYIYIYTYTRFDQFALVIISSTILSAPIIIAF
jgi:hypothetical protein